MDRREALALLAAMGTQSLAGKVFAQSEAISEPGRLNFFTGRPPSPLVSGRGFPYEAFDALPKTQMPVDRGVIDLAFAPGELSLPRDAIEAWVGRAAKSVITYYGHFPVASVRLLVTPVEGTGVRTGTTWGYGGAAIRMLVGEHATSDDLVRDWMMTHEMVHLALPDVETRHTWLAEGLAVYIEPIARVQAGYLTPKAVWADMARDMPRGQPTRDARGLDNTRSWASFYWGGALYCLLADIGIRGDTGNRFGLQDAMRGVLAAGGNHEVDWSIQRILSTADRAVGVETMTRLYERMRAAPAKIDLQELWRNLGVEVGEGGASFRDDAPLAPIRLALTEKPAVASAAKLSGGKVQ
jgi:hypothetical protein